MIVCNFSTNINKKSSKKYIKKTELREKGLVSQQTNLKKLQKLELN